MSSPGGETYRLEAFADAVFAIAVTLYMLPRAGAHAAASKESR